MKNNARTNVVVRMIESKGMTIPMFAKEVEIPYTTLISILKNNLESASVTNALKICKGLGITMDELLRQSGEIVNGAIVETKFEEKILMMEYLAELNDTDFRLVLDILKRLRQ